MDFVVENFHLDSELFRMCLNERILCFIIISILLLSFHIKTTNCEKSEENDRNVEINAEMQSRGTTTATDFGSIFSQFWNSLYVNRGFNSSFVLLLPLFTVTIPGYGRGLQHQTPLSALNIGNLSIFGIILFGSIALWSPILFPDFYPQNGRHFRAFPQLETIPDFLGKRLLELTERIIGKVLDIEDKEIKVQNFVKSRFQLSIDYLMSVLDIILDQIPQYEGLSPRECLKLGVCESHKYKKRFGVFGRILRFLFLPYGNSAKDAKNRSTYRLAANYGLKDKSIECKQRYNKCDINFAHLAHNLFEFLF